MRRKKIAVASSRRTDEQEIASEKKSCEEPTPSYNRRRSATEER
jgi:hypothetical protein